MMIDSMGMLSGFILGFVASGVAAILHGQMTRPRLGIKNGDAVHVPRKGEIGAHTFYTLKVYNKDTWRIVPGRKPAWSTLALITVREKTTGDIVVENVPVRWVEHSQPLITIIDEGQKKYLPDQQRISMNRTRDIHQHLPESINTIIKYCNDDYCYIFNDYSYFYDKWCNPAWRIGVGTYIMKITLFYDKRPESYEFLLKNNGNCREHIYIGPY